MKRPAKKVRDALEILIDVGVPGEQQNERSALTLLALADIRPRTAWRNAKAPLRRITEMMDWMKDFLPWPDRSEAEERTDSPFRECDPGAGFRLGVSRSEDLYTFSFSHSLGNGGLDRRRS